jgi:hypothetical protein
MMGNYMVINEITKLNEEFITLVKKTITMSKIRIIGIVLFVLFGSVEYMLSQETVDASSLNNKIMAGYQGWFNAPGSGNNYGWIHWTSGAVPAADNITFDMWPDMREYDTDELYETNFVYPDLINAGLFSSYNKKTVNRHVKWMKDYGIDGVFVQRFISSALSRPEHRDTVLQNVRYSCEEHGRVFANMYDMSGGNPASFDEDVKNDWMHLVDDLNITQSPNYLHHQGKPVLSLWGVHVGNSKDLLPVEKWATLVKWFTEEAPEKYRVTLKAGVGNGWKDDSSDWQEVYDAFEFISPWAVGRYSDIAGANTYKNKYFQADLDETASRGMEYIPVVFPGFSWANHYPGKPLNQIPRDGGKFFWRQFYNAVNAGCNMVYVAMFDEVDEGTAIFKIAEKDEQTPTTGNFVTLDIDGYTLPSDWYLRLTGAASQMLRNEIPLTATIPIVPYPENAEFIVQEVPTITPPASSIPVSITMKNTGTGNWTKEANYRLAFDTAVGPNNWGIDEIELNLNDTVAPGDSIHFLFEVNTPAEESVYKFQWRIIQGDENWIGEPSDIRLIHVGTDIPFLDDCDELSGWNSAGNLNLNISMKKQGYACVEFNGGIGENYEYQKTFSDPYNSGVSAYDAVLQFWYFVSDSSKLGSDLTVSLGSAGESESDNFSWSAGALSTGWNLIMLNTSDANLNGAPDLDSINWFSLYVTKKGDVTTRLDEIQILDKNAGAVRYELKVMNGSGSGKFAANSIVNISANEASAGQKFIGWEVVSGEPLFEDKSASKTKIRMPADNVEISAVYKILGAYLDDCDKLDGWASHGSIKINNSDHLEGLGCIEFTGNQNNVDEFKKTFQPAYNSGVSFASGKLQFWYYVSNASLMGVNNQVEIGSAGGPDSDEYNWNLSGLTTGWNFISLEINEASKMGNPDLNAINWFRLYNFKTGQLKTRIDGIEVIDPNAGERYSLTVKGGTGDGSYYAGTEVSISADAGEEGMFFEKWVIESGNPVISDKTSQTVTFLMPNENVVIAAVFIEVSPLTLTVINGSGSGEYDPGETIIIFADPAPPDQNFDQWVIESGTPTITSVTSPLTYLTMGIDDAIVRAMYKNATSIGNISSNDPSFNVYPNPAYSEFTIDFALERSSNVGIKMYDSTGQSIDLGINDRKMNAGKYQMVLPVSNLKSGIYRVILHIDDDYSVKSISIQ